MAKHKHYDLIVAWAEGKEIEAYSQLYKEWFPVREPFWSETTNYRIKPEPKPDIIRYLGVEVRNDCVENGTMWDEICYVSQWEQVLKLTFDGNTGKFKSAEVLDV